MTQVRQVTEIDLGVRELFSLCAGCAQTLSCISGEIWLTFDGRGEDVILRAGDAIELSGREGAVMSGLQVSTVSVSSTVGCWFDPARSAWVAARRLRWAFPELSSFPAYQLR